MIGGKACALGLHRPEQVLFLAQDCCVVLNQDRTCVGVGECEVVHCLDPFQGFPSEGAIEKLCPIVCGHNDFTVLTTNQLGMIDDGRFLNHPRYVVKASNFGATESLFSTSRGRTSYAPLSRRIR